MGGPLLATPGSLLFYNLTHLRLENHCILLDLMLILLIFGTIVLMVRSAALLVGSPVLVVSTVILMHPDEDDRVHDPLLDPDRIRIAYSSQAGRKHQTVRHFTALRFSQTRGR